VPRFPCIWGIKVLSEITSQVFLTSCDPIAKSSFSSLVLFLFRVHRFQLLVRCWTISQIWCSFSVCNVGKPPPAYIIFHKVPKGLPAQQEFFSFFLRHLNRDITIFFLPFLHKLKVIWVFIGEIFCIWRLMIYYEYPLYPAMVSGRRLGCTIFLFVFRDYTQTLL